MVSYVFDVEVANEYGVNEAIFIANMQFWILKNKSNEREQHDGRTWTYNSRKAFLEIFPFWSEQTLKTTINHLFERGVIVKGNYNNSPYDKTCWYAFHDEGKWIGESQTNDWLKSTNRKVKSNQPIPDINKDINTDIDDMDDAMNRFIQYRKEIKKSFKSQDSINLCKAKLRNLSNGDPDMAMEIVEQSISNGWQGLFALKQEQQPQQPQKQFAKQDEMTIVDVEGGHLELSDQANDRMLSMTDSQYNSLISWLSNNLQGKKIRKSKLSDIVLNWGREEQPQQYPYESQQTMGLTDIKTLLNKHYKGGF